MNKWFFFISNIFEDNFDDEINRINLTRKWAIWLNLQFNHDNNLKMIIAVIITTCVVCIDFKVCLNRFAIFITFHFFSSFKFHFNLCLIMTCCVRMCVSNIIRIRIDLFCKYTNFFCWRCFLYHNDETKTNQKKYHNENKQEK